MPSVSPESPFVTNHLLRDAVVAGSATAGMLLVEHVTLWDEPFRLNRPAAYVVGTATLGVGFTAWAIRHRLHQAAIAWWAIAGIGGVVVISAHWVRRVFDAVDERAFAAGQVAGRYCGNEQTSTPRD